MDARKWILVALCLTGCHQAARPAVELPVAKEWSFADGEVRSMKFAPDGQTIALVFRSASGFSGLMTVSPDAVDPVKRIPDATDPDFSADGTRFIFLLNNTLGEGDRSTQTARRMAAPVGGTYANPHYGPDDHQVWVTIQRPGVGDSCRVMDFPKNIALTIMPDPPGVTVAWFGYLEKQAAAVYRAPQSCTLQITDKVVYQWKNPQGGPIFALTGGRLLFYDQDWILWSGSHQALRHLGAQPRPDLTALAVSPDGTRLAWAPPGGGIFLGNPGNENGQKIQSLSFVSGLAFSLKGDQLVVATHRTSADGQKRTVLDLLKLPPL